LALFLRNAITNAIEASVQLHHDQRPVVVTWGTDDRDHWLAVLDEGSGPSADLPALAEIGASTKDGHPGMGLAIASQVATSLGGALELAGQRQGGCVCRLTWPRGEGRDERTHS